MIDTDPVRHLLRVNLSPTRLTACLLASLMGLLIVVSALQFYADTHTVFEPQNRADRFITVSKRVSLLGGAGGFTKDEIDSLRVMPWATGVDGYTANRFDLSAAVSLGGHVFSTKLFFEAVPDMYLDILPTGWDSAPGEDTPVPIILPRDYLALYNFGFAPAQGLPQVTEELLMAIPLRIAVGTGSEQHYLDAYVSGFTDRFNTILVPQRHLDYLNDRFAPGRHDNPERLIVETVNPDSPVIDETLSQLGWERDSGRVSPATGRISAAIAATATVIGLIILILSVFILFLNISLLMSQSRHTLHALMMLGYTPGRLGRIYIGIIAALNAIVVLLAVLLMLPLRSIWVDSVTGIGLTVASPLIALAVAVTLMAGVTVVAAFSINRSIRQYFKD